MIKENETSERILEDNRDDELRVPNIKYKQTNSNMKILFIKQMMMSKMLQRMWKMIMRLIN